MSPRNAQHRTSRISWPGGIGLRTRVLKFPQHRLSQEMHQGSMTGAAFLFPGHQERPVVLDVDERRVFTRARQPQTQNALAAPAPPSLGLFFSIRPASASARSTSDSTKPATDCPRIAAARFRAARRESGMRFRSGSYFGSNCAARTGALYLPCVTAFWLPGFSLARTNVQSNIGKAKRPFSSRDLVWSGPSGTTAPGLSWWPLAYQSAPMRADSNSGLTSAPRWPQTVQTKRSSRSDSRIGP
jgi:hypothetical protein